jgi:hypothetical protein
MNDAPDDPFDAEGFAQRASDPAPPQLLSSGDSSVEHSPSGELRKKSLRAEGRGFDPAVTQARSPGVSTPEVLHQDIWLPASLRNLIDTPAIRK